MLDQPVLGLMMSEAIKGKIAGEIEAIAAKFTR